ncbi:MAG: S24/S26 family peptidase [Fusicatenibacter sp.]|nr:S24/S26 family peptidase [Fusicatenibacter sp.]
MKTEKQWISSEALFSAIEELLSENRKAVFTVTGMSMWPFLCHGRDQVIVEQCDPSSLKKGDIILFQTSSGKYLLHRIIKLRENSFETAGDGNCFRDGWFDRSCLRARVIILIRDGKDIDCRSPRWKVIFQIWMALFPIRKTLLHLLITFSKRKKHENQHPRSV